MGKLNHHAIDNGDITSDVPVESNYDSVPDPDTTPIKSIYDDEMDQLLEFFQEMIHFIIINRFDGRGVWIWN